MFDFKGKQTLKGVSGFMDCYDELFS